MKKRKCLMCFLSIIICIFSFSACSNDKRDINSLMLQLGKAINEHNIKNVIILYPSYCRDEVSEQLSQNKMDEFYENVVKKDNEDIKIQILNITNFDNVDCKDIKDKIEKKYNEDVTIEDYQLVQIKYHDDFSESNLQVIKIDGNYYLYADAFFSEPISYFQE